MSTLIITLRQPDYSQAIRPDVLAGEERATLEEKLAIDRINRDHIRANRDLLRDVLHDVPEDQIVEVVLNSSLIISSLTDEQKQRIAHAVHARNLGIAGDDFEIELID